MFLVLLLMNSRVSWIHFKWMFHMKHFDSFLQTAHSFSFSDWHCCKVNNKSKCGTSLFSRYFNYESTKTINKKQAVLLSVTWNSSSQNQWQQKAHVCLQEIGSIFCQWPVFVTFWFFILNSCFWWCLDPSCTFCCLESFYTLVFFAAAHCGS